MKNNSFKRIMNSVASLCCLVALVLFWTLIASHENGIKNLLTQLIPSENIRMSVVIVVGIIGIVVSIFLGFVLMFIIGENEEGLLAYKIERGEVIKKRNQLIQLRQDAMFWRKEIVEIIDPVVKPCWHLPLETKHITKGGRMFSRDYDIALNLVSFPESLETYLQAEKVHTKDTWRKILAKQLYTFLDENEQELAYLRDSQDSAQQEDFFRRISDYLNPKWSEYGLKVETANFKIVRDRC